MDLNTWDQVKRIVEQALDHCADTRPGFLASACGNDPTLLAEVQALLESADTVVDDFLETPAVLPESPAVDETNWEGRQVGRYRVVRKLASGGMGHVYLGVDPMERLVAIKLPRMDVDPVVMAQRFAQEQAIQSRFDHPSIARVYDIGMAEGHPYMAMEYFEGMPIDEYCRKNQLGVHERIGLIIQACVAIEHVHSLGIVHGDIKPRNLLVTPDGELKLLDFGIAQYAGMADRDVEQPCLRTSAFTPECVAPEQLRRGPATEATDIYGLGTLLYRLLTETLPHAEHRTGSMMTGTLAAICDKDPVRASFLVARHGVPNDSGLPSAKHLVRLLRGPLDRLMAKAMARDPQCRHARVAELRADLRRCLCRQPSTDSAVRATLGQRVRAATILPARVRNHSWLPGRRKSASDHGFVPLLASHRFQNLQRQCRLGQA